MAEYTLRCIMHCGDEIKLGGGGGGSGYSPICYCLGQTNCGYFNWPSGAEGADIRIYACGSCTVQGGMSTFIKKGCTTPKYGCSYCINNISDSGFCVNNTNTNQRTDIIFYGDVNTVDPSSISSKIFGTGEDGDLVVNSKVCRICAKEWNFNNLTICPNATLYFCGQGVPILRVKGTFCNKGRIMMREPLLQNSFNFVDPYSGISINSRRNPEYSAANSLLNTLNTMCTTLGNCLTYAKLSGASADGGAACEDYGICAGGSGGKTNTAGNYGGGSCCGLGGAAGTDAGGGGGGSAGKCNNSYWARSGCNGTAGGNGIGGTGGQGGDGCAGNSGTYGMAGSGGGGGFGCLQGGNGGKGGTIFAYCGTKRMAKGGNGGNSWCGKAGDGGDGGDCCCSDGTNPPRTLCWGYGGNGGCSYYGNAGNGGRSFNDYCYAGNGGCSYCGNAGNGKIGGNTVWGNGGCSYNGNGGCSYYGNGGNAHQGYSCIAGSSVYGNGGNGCYYLGCNCCPQAKGGCSIYGNGGTGYHGGRGLNGGNTTFSYCGGHAWHGSYGLGLFACIVKNEGNICGGGGKGGNGCNCVMCDQYQGHGGDGSELYIVTKDFANTGTITYEGGCGGNNYPQCGGATGIFKLYRI